MGGAVHICQQAAAVDPGGFLAGVHLYAVHRPQVDDEPVVAHSQAPGIVSPASDRREHACFRRETHGGDHIVHARAAGDQGRPPVDHGVVYLAGLLVPRVPGLEKLAPKYRL